MSIFFRMMKVSITGTFVGTGILIFRKVTNTKISPNAYRLLWIMFIITLIVPVGSPNKLNIYKIFNTSFIDNYEGKNDNYNCGFLAENFDSAKTSLILERVDKSTGDMNDDVIQKVLVNIWWISCLLLLIKILRSCKRLITNTGNNEISDKRLIDLLDACKTKLKITRNIRLINQTYTKFPAIIGLIDVRILLTDDILELSDTELENIFMHELAHYKKKDNIWNIVLLILKAVYWFNPVILMALRKARQDMELSTDEIAVGGMNKNEKIEYCRSMIRVAGMCGSRTEPILGFADERSVLEERIDNISLMWLLLYPTAYGIMEIPKLYVTTDSGKATELKEYNEKTLKLNSLDLTTNSVLKIGVDDSEIDGRIMYERINLEDNQSRVETIDTSNKRISYFEPGHYVYKFTIKYKNGKTVDYGVYIKVE